jgi:hypothetical protein
MAKTLFLLSPANTAGRRAQMLFNERATFPLAVALQRGEAAPLGEVFSFLSGLYFRGKLAYARAFAASPGDIQVITSDRGLLSPFTPITLAELRAFATSPIDVNNASYAGPLVRDARALAGPARKLANPQTRPVAVLLGSIASGKYVDLLLPVFGDQLVFPGEFVGRGDMSRGGLMLRCTDTRSELDYIPVSGAIRHGSRPPKLNPR